MNLLRPWHVLVLLIVILILFGAKRLPDFAKSVGQSLKIFKNEVKDLADDSSAEPSTPTQTPVTSPPSQAPGSAPPLPPSHEGLESGNTPRP